MSTERSKRSGRAIEASTPTLQLTEMPHKGEPGLRVQGITDVQHGLHIPLQRGIALCINEAKSGAPLPT